MQSHSYSRDEKYARSQIISLHPKENVTENKETEKEREITRSQRM